MVPKIRTGRGIRGLVDYVTHDPGHQKTHDRVGWLHAENLSTANPERAAKIMAATVRDAERKKLEAGITGGRRLEKTVIHLSLSWPPDRRPDQAEMISAGREAMRTLKVEDHQALMVAHTDEAHPHLHLVIGRTHPETGIAAPLSKDRLALSRWAEDWERNHEGIRCEQRVENNARRRAGEFVRYEPPVEPQRQAVRYIGPEAFQAACKDLAKPALWEATGREDADRRLAELGLRIEDVKRGGQVVTDGTHQAKLSAVAAGLPKLEKAWRANAERSDTAAHAADAGLDRQKPSDQRAPDRPRGEDRGADAAPDLAREADRPKQNGPADRELGEDHPGIIRDAIDTAAVERAIGDRGHRLGAVLDRFDQSVDQVSGKSAESAGPGRSDLGELGQGRPGDRVREHGHDPATPGRPVVADGRGLESGGDPNRVAGHPRATDPFAAVLAAATERAAVRRRNRTAAVTEAIHGAASDGERAIADADRRQLAALGAVITAGAWGLVAGLRGHGLGYLDKYSQEISERDDPTARRIYGEAEEQGGRSNSEERRPIHDIAAGAGWAVGRLVRSPVDITETGYKVWRHYDDRRLLDRYQVRADGNDRQVGIWDTKAREGHGRFVDQDQVPARAQHLLAEPLAVEKVAQEARQEARIAAQRARDEQYIRQREADRQQRLEEMRAYEARKDQELQEIRSFGKPQVGVGIGGNLGWRWPDQDKISGEETQRRADLVHKHWSVMEPVLTELFKRQDPVGYKKWDTQRERDCGYER